MEKIPSNLTLAYFNIKRKLKNGGTVHGKVIDLNFIKHLKLNLQIQVA